MGCAVSVPTKDRPATEPMPKADDVAEKSVDTDATSVPDGETPNELKMMTAVNSLTQVGGGGHALPLDVHLYMIQVCNTA